MVRQLYPHPFSASNSSWLFSSHVKPLSILAFIVIFFRSFVSLGLEKSNKSFPRILSEASTWMRLAIQTGSCNAFLEEGCSIHVLPISVVVETALLPPRLSRILSIRTPGLVSTTCASVVLVRANVLISHFFPWSLL